MAIKVHGATVIDNSKHITVSGAQVDGTLLLPEAGLLQVSKDNGSVGQFGASDTELITIGNSSNNKNIILRSSGFADFKQVNVNQILKVGGDNVQINPDGSSTFAGTVAVNELTIGGSSVNTSAEVDAKIAAIPATDLSGYDTSSQVDSKISTAIGAIPSVDLSGYDTSTEVDAKIAAIPSVDLAGYDTTAQVNAKIANLENALISGAPEALNTLVELSTALGDDANFATTVTNSLAGKANLSGATFTGTVDAPAFTVNGSPLEVSGSQTIISDTAPSTTDNDVGTLWWNSDSSDGSLYVLYQDPSGPAGDAGGKYWIEASPAPDSIGFNGSHTGDSVFNGNIDVTGNVTATYFMGNLSGNLLNSQGQVVVDANNPDFGLPFSGGTMTGDIVMGSPAVSTIGIDGDATFAGAVNATYFIGDLSGKLLNSQGQVVIDSDNPDFEFDGNLTGNLDVTGNASFGGNVLSLGVTPEAWHSGVTRALRIGAGGAISSQINNRITEITTNAWHSGTSWKYIANDSATNYYQYLGEHVFNVAPSGTADNDITFTDILRINSSGINVTGTVNTGVWPNNSSTSLGGGAYMARQDTGTSVVWKAFSGGTGDSYVTSQIKADGSASFANGYTFFNEGYNYFKSPSTGNSILLQIIDGNDSANVTFKANGSATFNSDVNVATAVIAGSSSYLSSPIQGTTNKSDRTAILGINHHTSGDVFEGRRGDTGATTSRINALGSATFAGQLRVDNQAQIYRPAAVGGSTSGNTLLIFKSDVGGTSVTKASITTDGAAEFAGDLTLGSYNTGSNGVRGLFYTETAGLTVQAPAGTTQSLLKGLGGNSSDVKFNILADGSATFVGEVSANTGAFSRDVTNDNVTILYAGNDNGIKFAAKGNGTYIGTSLTNINNATPTGSNITLSTDGSAKFVGAVIHGQLHAGGTGGNYLSNGEVAAYGPTSSSNLWRGWDVSGSSNVLTSSISATGAASFAGNFDVGAWQGSNNSAQGTRIYSTGYIQSNRTSAGAGCFSSSLNGTVTAQILADGTATFGAFNQSSTSGNGTIISHDGQVTVQRPNGSSSYLFRGFQGTTEKYFVKADGSASFGSGTLTIGSTGWLQTSQEITSDRTGGNVFRGKLNGTVTSAIAADGAATFARTQFAIGNDGTLTLATNDGGSGIIQSTNWSIDGNGSASFDGNIEIGNYDASSSSGQGVIAYASGGLNIQRAAGTSIENRFQIRSGDTTVIGMKNDGSANFTGDVELTFPDNSTGLRNKLSFATESPFQDEVAYISADRTNVSNAPTDLVFATGNVISISERMRIDSSGNFRHTPGGGTSSTYLQGKVENTTDYVFRAQKDGVFSTAIVFATQVSGAAREAMRIDTSGNITATGTVAAAGLTPGYMTAIMPSGENPSSWGVINGKSDASTVTSQIRADGSAMFAGNITAGNVSDIKFKENIADANPQLSDVVALGGILKNWDWKEEAPLNEELKAKRFLGLVAQEAEEICPGIVYDVHRKVKGEELTPETTDEDGNVTPATYEEVDDSYKAINHDILVMKLLGAIAELEAKVAALEAG